MLVCGCGVGERKAVLGDSAHDVGIVVRDRVVANTEGVIFIAFRFSISRMFISPLLYSFLFLMHKIVFDAIVF